MPDESIVDPPDGMPPWPADRRIPPAVRYRSSDGCVAIQRPDGGWVGIRWDSAGMVLTAYTDDEVTAWAELKEHP